MSHPDRVDLKPDQIELKKGSLWQKLPLIGGGLAVLGLGGAWTMKAADPGHFWHAYLTAFMFTLALGLGGLFFVVVQHVVRAGWSIVVRRIAENVMITLPVTALFGFLIVYLGAHDLYEWTHDKVLIDTADGLVLSPIEEDPMLSAKAGYLNEGRFQSFYVVYYFIWTALALAFWKWSSDQDDATDPKPLAHRMRFLAAPAVALFAFSSTFGAFDFMMSLDPHWFSTMWGVWFFAGMALTIHSLLVLILALLQRTGHLKGVVTPEHYHDLGKYMFGFTVFWAYITFSQYFLQWYADIPEETHWFSYRGHGQWLTLAILIIFGRFVVPWFILFRRPLKRNPGQLAIVAAFIVLMEYVEIFWVVHPAHAHHAAMQAEFERNPELVEQLQNTIHFGAVDVLCLVGFIGVFLAVFGWSLKSRPLVPVKDPRLAESIHFENF
jgi:hypothetical protein